MYTKLIHYLNLLKSLTILKKHSQNEVKYILYLNINYPVYFERRPY